MTGLACCSRPTVPEVAPLVAALYERHCAGCCFHIVLDDGNVEDSSVEFCMQFAAENECSECMALGPLLLRMSRTQRSKLRRYALGTRR